MIYLVNFASPNMTRSQLLCGESAKKHGVDIVWPQNTDTLDKGFIRHNAEIFMHERGYGYWIWKPLIIYEAMIKAAVEDGDIIIYADAGVEFVNSVHYIIDRMDEDIFFFTNGFPHVEWCKTDPMDAILHWYTKFSRIDIIPEMMAYRQVQASVIFFRVNETTRKFVKEWLLYCQMPGFIDDSPSKLPNYPTFAEHRHDQAILTCMQIKYGYKLHFWPTNYSEHIRHLAQPGDNYPTIFNHHRKRNVEWEG
jgi:hypothetical protein